MNTESKYKKKIEDKGIKQTFIAKKLGISRIAVFKRIQKGQIKAIKIGRSYAISRSYFETHTDLLAHGISPDIINTGLALH